MGQWWPQTQKVLPVFHRIKQSAAMVALSLAALGAQAQHAVSVNFSGNDRALVEILNTGHADIIGAELFAGVPIHSRVIFAADGTDGVLDYRYGSTDHYSVTTWEPELAPGQSAVFNVNLDTLALTEGVTFASSVVHPTAYSAMRLSVLWRDGFERWIPVSRGLSDGAFSFNDIPPLAPVPEPGGALLLVGLAHRKIGGAA